MCRTAVAEMSDIALAVTWSVVVTSGYCGLKVEVVDEIDCPWAMVIVADVTVPRWGVQVMVTAGPRLVTAVPAELVSATLEEKDPTLRARICSQSTSARRRFRSAGRRRWSWNRSRPDWWVPRQR